MIRNQRTTLVQEWAVFPVTVAVTPTPVALSLGPSSMISTVVFSVPTTAANSVFLGNDATVSLTTGIEIPAGIPQQYRTINERELIELESPLLDILFNIICAVTGKGSRVQSENVPLVVWDISKMFLVATAPTAMTVATFKEMWI